MSCGITCSRTGDPNAHTLAISAAAENIRAAMSGSNPLSRHNGEAAAPWCTCRYDVADGTRSRATGTSSPRCRRLTLTARAAIGHAQRAHAGGAPGTASAARSGTTGRARGPYGDCLASADGRSSRGLA